LLDIEVLEEDYSSEWLSSSFSIPKKNVTKRIVINFRKLNSLLKSHPFPFSTIEDMIRSMKVFTFVTVKALDLSMGYCHIKLDSDAQKLRTIVSP
jgi:hypothetical protein